MEQLETMNNTLTKVRATLADATAKAESANHEAAIHAKAAEASKVAAAEAATKIKALEDHLSKTTGALAQVGGSMLMELLARSTIFGASISQGCSTKT